MPDVAYSSLLDGQYVYDRREGVRQKPYVQPKELPYMRVRLDVTEASTWGGGTLPTKANSQSGVGQQTLVDAVTGTLSANQLVAQAYSRAYNKLLSKVGERASMLTFMAERKSTATMVLNRLTQLYRGAKALRRGRFREFCNTFGIKPKSKHKDNRWSRPRDFSSLWLEYWFGWAPTVADLGTAIDVWQADVSDVVKVRAVGGTKKYEHSYYQNDRYLISDIKTSGKFFLQLRAEVRVTNPDLWAATNMGFLNPVKTFWETTPFSWFADWFTNIGQVLGSFTDQIGCKISDVWVSRFVKAKVHDYHYDKYTKKGREFDRSLVLTRREKRLTLPRPTLIFKIPNLSWTRGLTLSALLVQLFSPQAKRLS